MTLTITSPPEPVSEMERSRVALVAIMCVLISRISGAEVEMKVTPGDDVTLYCDCDWKSGFYMFWFRNCSHENQPPLIISTNNLIHSAEPSPDLRFGAFPRYAPVWNQSSNTADLLVRNVSESDLGLYYCARYEKKIRKDADGLHYGDVYHYGNRTTRLSLLDMLPPTPSPHPVSDCSVCWKLLVSVCPACVLLSLTCVYCIYRNTNKGSEERREHLTDNVFQVCCAEEHQCERSMNGEFCFHTEVCYTSLKSK